MKHGDPLVKGVSRTQFKKGQKPSNYSGIDTCTIDGCNDDHSSKGWCQKHFMRWYHHGDPLAMPSRIRGEAIDRFNFWHEKKPNGCWEWKGHLDQRGYGRFVDETGWTDMAHRWSYKHFVGKIPKGLVIDHLCHTPKCVNWMHLEPVTHYENVIERGKSNASYLNSKKTHCIRGHELTKGNYYFSKNKYNGTRVCKICHKQRVKKYLSKIKNNA